MHACAYACKVCMHACMYVCIVMRRAYACMSGTSCMYVTCVYICMYVCMCCNVVMCNVV